MCRKELRLLRESNITRESGRELVISFLEKKEDDIKNKLCKLCIDETKIAPSQSEEVSHSRSVVRNIFYFVYSNGHFRFA
jgi:hypothetical protein